MWLRRSLIAIFSLLIIGGLAAASFAVTQLNEYTLYVDGNVVQVNGAFDTVADVVTAANISLSSGDLVVPDMAAAIEPDAAIQVLRAKQVTVTTDDGTIGYYTHQPTLGAFLREIQLVIGRTDQILADGNALTLRQVNDASVPTTLTVGRFHSISILDGNDLQTITTNARTVGAALAEAGITLYAADGVNPPSGEWITPGLRIEINRSIPLTIAVDGRELRTRSHRTRVVDILAEAGIGLVGADFTRPGLDVEISAEDRIEVVRVTEDIILEDTPIPFEVLWQPTEQFDIDTTGLLSAGREGVYRKRTRVQYENGVETARIADGEWVAQEAVNEVLGYGTKITVQTLDTPEGPIEYWRKVRMRVTSYTAASSGKPPDHPAYGITRSGLVAGKGIVAIDPTVVPWRSDLYVEGYGKGHAGDTGGGVKGRWIDLGYGEDDYIGWRGYTDVYFLTPVPEPERINFLIPRQLP